MALYQVVSPGRGPICTAPPVGIEPTTCGLGIRFSASVARAGVRRVCPRQAFRAACVRRVCSRPPRHLELLGQKLGQLPAPVVEPRMIGLPPSMAHDLKLSSPLPLQIARDRLVGPQGATSSYTDQLMKLGKSPLDNLWGAAWDLVHLDATTLFQSGAIADVDGRAVVLVTADRGLTQLRQRIIDIPDTVDTPLGPMPLKLGRNELDKRLQDQADKIAGINAVLNESVRARIEGRADRPTPESISGLIPQLELDVVAALEL